MPIVPDDKNWTWVLERACPDCGFDASSFDATTTAVAIEANAALWPSLVDHPHAADRPDDHTWSAVEYACHVRDVYRLYLYRLDLMLSDDDPQFPDWDQDATAVAEHYDRQDADSVVGELRAAAGMLAARFLTVSGAQWTRTGRRSDGAAFTVDSFARYLLHDPVHHVWDVQRGYETLDAVTPG
jgi:hypothetical protein